MRGDLTKRPQAALIHISIHFLRMGGGETWVRTVVSVFIHFYTLPSYEGRRAERRVRQPINFYTLPSYEGRHVLVNVTVFRFDISIHSPRTRGDDVDEQTIIDQMVSIHSPRMRGRPVPVPMRSFRIDFYTLPSYEGRRLLRPAPAAS